MVSSRIILFNKNTLCDNLFCLPFANTITLLSEIASLYCAMQQYLQIKIQNYQNFFYLRQYELRDTLATASNQLSFLKGQLLLLNLFLNQALITNPFFFSSAFCRGYILLYRICNILKNFLLYINSPRFCPIIYYYIYIYYRTYFGDFFLLI